jgi:hypothetical protein
LKRRLFFGAAGAAIALSGATWLVLHDQSCGEHVHPTIKLTFDECWRIQEIGDAYRAAFPDEDNVDTLQRLISQAGSSEDLAAIIQREFAEDSTVEVLGWLLSRTEARHCALSSLLNA